MIEDTFPIEFPLRREIVAGLQRSALIRSEWISIQQHAPSFHLTVSYHALQTCKGCTVKRLTAAFLIVGILSSTVCAQSTDQVIKDRRRVFVGWLGIIKTAESKYRSKHGVYGNLTALRGAHLLGALVFASGSSTDNAPDSSVIPTSTDFQVRVSSDGHHYRVTIRETVADVGQVGLYASEMSTEWMVGHTPQLPEDGPQGPLPSIAR
jgi:hypothetical protein